MTIPITSTTPTLTLDKTIELIHNLQSHQKDNDLPLYVQGCIDTFLKAQTNFVHQMYQYLHSSTLNSHVVETVKTIAETCPNFLATRNQNALLPIHNAAINESRHIFVPLFAQIAA